MTVGWLDERPLDPDAPIAMGVRTLELGRWQGGHGALAARDWLAAAK